MFSNAKEILSIFGFKLRIDPSWFIIAALIVWSLSTAYFPEKIAVASQYELLLIAIISMLGLFLSLVLHELSHALAARIFNLKVGNITLFIFGGVAELERDPEDAKSEFWIAIAGPAMSFLLAGLFTGLASLSDSMSLSIFVVEILAYLGLVNLVLAIFNLIPAFPLDGGRILRSIIWYAKSDVISATYIASQIGKFFAVTLIILGLFFLFSSQLVTGLWQILIGTFIYTASKTAYEDLIMRRVLKGNTVWALMTRNPWVASVDDSVQTLVDCVILKHNVSFVPVVEGEHLLGYVDAAMIQTIERENWADTKLGDIYIATSEKNTTYGAAPIHTALDCMTSTGNRKLLVANKGKLEGVISLADLLKYLSIRHELGIYPKQNPSQTMSANRHV